MNTLHEFTISINISGSVTDAHKEFVAGKILAAVEDEKANHGLTPDDAEEICADSIVSCDPVSAITYKNCKPAGNIGKYSEFVKSVHFSSLM